MPVTPFWHGLIRDGYNTAWEALLSLPPIVPYSCAEELEYLNELNALLMVERRDPEVRAAIRGVLRERGMN